MKGRTTLALAVLAAAGLSAQAQQPGEAQTQPDRDAGIDIERDIERAETELQRAETEIARAAGVEAGSGMQLSALQVERSEHGRYLTDQDGRALYLLEGESGGQSNCYDRCAEQWPPAIVAQGQMPEAEGRRVNEEMLGTYERRDGSTQITYGDYPLYYYVMDQEAGDLTGHDVHDEWGGWYLVSPDGEPLEGDESGGSNQD